MSYGNDEMLDVMKDVKYRRTLETLKKMIKDARGDFVTSLTVALNVVAETVHAEAGTLWLYDRFGDGLIRPKAVYGGGELKDIYLMPGEGVAGQVIESGKGSIISDCQKDSRWAGKVDSTTGFSTKSMICVPLTAGEDVFGCIQILNKTGGLLFDDRDMEFTGNLAKAASELLVSLGFLREYEAERSRNRTRELSFREVFCAEDDETMMFLLRSNELFAGLGISEQEKVLQHAREIRKILNRKEENRRRRR